MSLSDASLPLRDSSSLAGLPVLDPSDPHFVENPYPVYAALRARAPVHWSPLLGGWIVTRYDDVVAILKDGRRFSAARSGAIAGALADAPGQEFTQLFNTLETWLLMQDGAEHALRRKILIQGFLPRVVRGMESLVQARVDALLDAAAARSSMDAIIDFAHPLPVHIISGMLRAPSSDQDKVLAWSEDIGAVLGAKPLSAEIARAGQRSFLALYEHFRGIVAETRQRPGDDFLSALVTADDDGRRLNEDELLIQLGMLLFSGHETTRYLIGNTLHQLLVHPGARARLLAEPALLDGAIEETLRYEPPIQFSMRIAVEDVALGGHTVRAGQAVLAFAGAANRDPAHFEDPETFDITRKSGKQLGFGHGPHFCIGHQLARIQARSAIGSLLRRFPGLRLAPDRPPVRNPVFGFRGFRSVPVLLAT